MAIYNKKPDFSTSEEGIMAAKVLRSMMLDKAYITEPSFSADSEKYADNLMPFIDKHLAYLRNHPAIDPGHYLANLKLMTKVRK